MPEPVFTKWDMHPRPPVFGAEEIETEEMHNQLDIPAPSQPGEEQREKRRPVSLFQIIVILLFLLAPIFNSFLRNFVSDRSSGPPVLREAGFCERYSAGAPVNAKRTFSLRRDRQVVLYSEWRGARRNHAVSMRWYTPEGALSPQSNSETQYQAGRREFAAVSVLPLRGGMPEGQWKAEVLLDGQLRGKLNFELTE
ncbi:MAG: hypothetical protein HYX72_07520 [Acidobacteria bacterium]|nr:hypothetical protein [Acidobacteriota bacterium]